MVRKFTKSKSIFPTDDAIRKVVYMSVSEISKKWTMPVRDWGLAYAQFMIYFEDRFAAQDQLGALSVGQPLCHFVTPPPLGETTPNPGVYPLEDTGEVEKQRISSAALHRISCSRVGALSSVALFRCIFSFGTFFGFIRIYTVIFSDPGTIMRFNITDPDNIVEELYHTIPGLLCCGVDFSHTKGTLSSNLKDALKLIGKL